jgi:hypothetical protein
LHLELVRLPFHLTLRTFDFRLCFSELFSVFIPHFSHLLLDLLDHVEVSVLLFLVLGAQLNVFIDDALEVFRRLGAMLFEVLRHLSNFVLQRFTVPFGFLEVASSVNETFVVILANGKFVLDCFQLGFEALGFDCLGAKLILVVSRLGSLFLIHYFIYYNDGNLKPKETHNSEG